MSVFLRDLFRFRRGPWEMVASIIIALGVFMLITFYSLWLYLFLYYNSGWHCYA